ncbi:CLUMA_CG020740, isoform A [Clunio marinus]|uniref:CLUMA_CG020740, isoform A n=1 Tax=Clunio marinus TaxID=568069 RepID=A0A1J1J726_9DIPT|nr:CLUMA_CG020740, isoform A [Clunio marinus]
MSLLKESRKLTVNYKNLRRPFEYFGEEKIHSADIPPLGHINNNTSQNFLSIRLVEYFKSKMVGHVSSIILQIHYETPLLNC